MQGRYKKQTGGRGPVRRRWLEVEPLPRGGGFEFVDKIFGGSIPRNFIPSVEKGVRDCMKRGILAGYPVVDLKVTLYDGSYHDVDSSDMAFQIAASMGLQKGFMEARPSLLEPIMNVEVTAPVRASPATSSATSTAAAARIVGHGAGAARSVAVRAQVPMAEMLTYESNLRSMIGRPRRLLDGVLALRGGAGPAGREGRRGGQGGEGKGPLNLSKGASAAPSEPPPNGGIALAERAL